jgi:hypothetical protein
MANSYKRSGIAANGAIGTYSNLYFVPASASASVISTLAVCNTTASAQTYRIGLSSGSATDPTSADHLAYGAAIAPNDSIFISIGAAIATGTYVRVAASSSSVCFNAFVSEIT